MGGNMKKIFVLLTTLALLTLTACISKDAQKKVTESPAAGVVDSWTEVTKIPVSLSTGEPIEATLDSWGTLPKFEEGKMDGFNNVYKVSSNTSSWGTCFCLDEITGLLTKYESITFKIKPVDFDTIKVKIPEVEKMFPMSSGTSLANGWYEIKVPFSAFSSVEGIVTDTAKIAILGESNATFYITDVVLTVK